MYLSNLGKFVMQIQLTDTDLEKMPQSLRSEFLTWLGHRNLKSATSSKHRDLKKPQNSGQLTLAVDVSTQSVQDQKHTVNSTKLVKPSSSHANYPKSLEQDGSHVRLTQLFDTGITKPGMPVRVKLSRELEKQFDRCYITNGLAISTKGTVLYKGEEFDKPSPLAKRVTGSNVNGWEYVEVQKNGKWICLSELRKVWRSVT